MPTTGTQYGAAPDRVITRHVGDDFAKMYVAPDSMARIRSGNMLNEEALMGAVAALAGDYLQARGQIAVFSTYEYKRFTDHNTPSNILRQVRRTSFWSKDVILIPVHFEMHWMLAIVHIGLGTIDFFDSLDFSTAWRRHGEVRCAPHRESHS